jgi:hypothetical protein
MMNPIIDWTVQIFAEEIQQGKVEEMISIRGDFDEFIGKMRQDGLTEKKVFVTP